MASTDARPVPKKNVAYRHYFAIRKNDGTLITTWAGQDSELSKDGGNFGDATNEATEIQTSGCGYIDLTLGEMNYNCVTLKVTVTNTDALPYVVNLFPEDTGDIRITPTDGSITAAKLGADCITAAKIADDAISAEHINTGALTADAFAADALVAATFATGAFTADAFAANALVAGTFAASSLDGKGDWNTTTPPTAAAVRTEIDNNSTQLAAIVADTNELQTDNIPGTLSTIAAYLDSEVAAILTDTGTTIPALIAALNNITAAAVKTAIEAGGSSLAQILADTGELQTNQGAWATATGFAVAGNAMALTGGERNSVADAVLKRAVQNVEDSADKHSLGALIMFVTNWSISGSTLTAKKPSDDSQFQTYTLATDEDADPVSGVS